MTECELLPECAFFRKHSETHAAACRGMIAEYCRGNRQVECKRKAYLLKHGVQPPENMLPGGSIIKLDAPVVCGGPRCREGGWRYMKALAGTGMSTAHDASEAGREAAVTAVSYLAGEPPALVVVFTTPRYDLPGLLSGIRSVTGSAILIGCTGAGQMVRGRHMGFGAGVSVLTLSAGPYRFGAASAGHIREDLGRAGREIARASREAAGPSPFSTVLLLADALAGDLQELVKGIYRTTGPGDTHRRGGCQR